MSLYNITCIEPIGPLKPMQPKTFSAIDRRLFIDLWWADTDKY